MLRNRWPRPDPNSTTAAWWPMPGCSFRPPWRGTSACPNCSTWAMPRGGRTRMMTLVASALAGGDCIDDPMCCAPGGRPAPWAAGEGAIHPGHLPAQLPVGPRPSTHYPGLPTNLGDGPLTISCETYGPKDARHHGYTGKRGYHPLLAVAAGTGDVLG